MGKNISFRQLVADKMKGYDFESCEIADTIKAAKDTAREYTSKIKAAASVEERNVLETNTSAEVKNLADALANFEFWQNVLNERLHELAAAQIDDTLEAAVREYGMRNNESWLTKVSLAKLGISYTDSLCDTENRCMSALCDTLSKLIRLQKKRLTLQRQTNV